MHQLQVNIFLKLLKLQDTLLINLMNNYQGKLFINQLQLERKLSINHNQCITATHLKNQCITATHLNHALLNTTHNQVYTNHLLMFTNLKEIFTSLQEEKCTNHQLNMLHLNMLHLNMLHLNMLHLNMLQLNMLHLRIRPVKVSGNQLQLNTVLLYDKTSAHREDFNKMLLHPPTKVSGNKHQEDEIFKLRII